MRVKFRAAFRTAFQVAMIVGSFGSAWHYYGKTGLYVLAGLIVGARLTNSLYKRNLLRTEMGK